MPNGILQKLLLVFFLRIAFQNSFMQFAWEFSRNSMLNFFRNFCLPRDFSKSFTNDFSKDTCSTMIPSEILQEFLLGFLQKFFSKDSCSNFCNDSSKNLLASHYKLFLVFPQQYQLKMEFSRNLLFLLGILFKLFQEIPLGFLQGY